MDWINCNTCCRQPGDEKERIFTLTSCGHIFCDVCLAQAECPGKCGACSSQCQLIPLSSKMKPETEIFFLEPGVLLKRQHTQINRLLDFQKDHRVRLLSFHRKVLEKYKALEKQYSLTVSHVQELNKKYSAVKSRNQDLEVEIQKLRSIISTQGGPGKAGSLGQYPCMEHYQRVGTSNKHSPKGIQATGTKVSPGGTRISPGRLTLVKTSHGSVMSGHSCSPTNVPANTSGHTIPYGTVQVPRTPSSRHSSPPQPYHVIGHQNPHQRHSENDLHVGTPVRHGVGYFKSSTPSSSGKPSPTRLAMVPSKLHAASAGLKALQTTQHSSHHNIPGHHGSQPDLRPTFLQTQPFTVHSSNTAITSPSSFMNQMQGHSSTYGKFIM
ncbi:E3 ubiquitin-protein ligase RNF212B isoform X2 [Cherax quadricarinatus]